CYNEEAEAMHSAKDIFMSDSNIDAHISDSTYGPISTPAPAETTAPSSSSSSAAVTDSSSIETSEMAASLMIGAPGIPILPSPSDSSVDLGLSISALQGSQKFLLAFLAKMSDEMNAIKQDILDKWAKNIEEIQEQIRRLINSPEYQYKREIQIKG